MGHNIVILCQTPRKGQYIIILCQNSPRIDQLIIILCQTPQGKVNITPCAKLPKEGSTYHPVPDSPINLTAGDVQLTLSLNVLANPAKLPPVNLLMLSTHLYHCCHTIHISRLVWFSWNYYALDGLGTLNAQFLCFSSLLCRIVFFLLIIPICPCLLVPLWWSHLRNLALGHKKSQR